MRSDFFLFGAISLAQATQSPGSIAPRENVRSCSHQDGRHIHRYSIHIVCTHMIMIHIDIHMIYIRYRYDTVKRLNQNKYIIDFQNFTASSLNNGIRAWKEAVQSDVHCNDVFLMPGVRQPLHA